MKNVIIGIGIPGSGKSTLLKKYAEENGWKYVCPDNVRLELTGDATDHTQEGAVWKKVFDDVAEYIKKGHTVVVDATFGDDRQRQEFLDFARTHGAQKIEGVYVNTSLETSKERNKGRERIVPDFAIERIHDSLTKYPPKISEGFDAIFELTEDGIVHEITADTGGREIKRSLGKLR